MLEFAASLFDSAGFVPRWQCGAWSPALGALHIASDLFIWLAYVAIPVVLIALVRQRSDIPFPKLFWLFGAFIISCGTTHLIEAVIFYRPIYPLAGAVKFFTAVVSWATVFALIPIIPAAMAMRTPAELDRQVAARTAELEAANAALRESEARFRQLADAMPQVVWTADPRGVVDYRNRRTDELVGPLPPREWNTLVHPEDRPAFERAWGESLASGRPSQNELRVRGAGQADYRWFLRRAVPVRDERGRLVKWIGTSTDIHEQKQAERESQRVHALLTQAGHLAQLGAWVVELPPDPADPAADWPAGGPPGGGTLWWSEQVFELFGYAPGAVPPTRELFYERVHPDDRAAVAAAVARAVATGEPYQLEHRAVRADDGSTRVLAERAEVVRGPAGRAARIVGAVQDVTDRRLAEDQLRRLNAELEARVRERTADLEASNKELEAFSYSVSHDLRAPLRAVNGFAKIALEEYGPALPEAGRDCLRDVCAGARKMGQLVDDLLAFSRLGRRPVSRRPVDTAALVRDCLAELAPSFAGRCVEVVVGELPPCEADPALVRQVWVNLLGNALKYTGRRAEAVVEVGGRGTPAGPLYWVRDNGVGFDMAYAHKLFGVFQRLHRAEEYEGSGVGLAIVRRVVGRHGGRAWAEAEPGRGATFSFTLPPPAAADPDAGPGAEPAATPEPRRG